MFENSDFGSVHSIKCGMVLSVHHIYIKILYCEGGVPGEGPCENSRSLLSPKLELWPKNLKKGDRGRGVMATKLKKGEKWGG